MPVTVIVGLQWGDEGKGKIVDHLARASDMVVRFQGGANAGHTVVVGDQEIVFHLLPAGVLHEGVENVIGNGVVVDPETLLGEIDALEEMGKTLRGRLHVSNRAHLVFPYHKWQDRAADSRAGENRIGTTVRGIGPAYADKVHRHTAIRFADLTDSNAFRRRVDRIVGEKNRWQEVFGGAEPISADKLADQYLEYFERLREYVCDTSYLVRERAAAGKKILMEGANGTLLDVDFGTYPYVTSSNCTALGSLQGAGLPMKMVSKITGVLKAYQTRVGEGPFPTELTGDEGASLREKGSEYGATTGRPRRCGWFDAVAGRFTVELNGVDEIALTKMDVLDGIDPLRVCTSYRHGPGLLEQYPAEARVLSEVEPIYEELPGWKGPTSGLKKFDDLPKEAREYVGFLEEKIGAAVSMISVGRRRDQIIIR